MTDRQITRGDDYWEGRFLYTIEVVDDALAPYAFTSCTIYSTWREEPVAPGLDGTDATAPLAASITFDGAGEVTDNHNLILPTGASADDGILILIADRSTTTNMPLADELHGDLQITNAQGMVETVYLIATLMTRDGYTSRVE
jgi:hypothetical protein